MRKTNTMTTDLLRTLSGMAFPNGAEVVGMIQTFRDLVHTEKNSYECDTSGKAEGR
ncbi:MAG: hypothetical protein KGH60_03960 [Candidatus Micrarchaeota archaeon]|nr:hypothetical protein [Candidatus Micrarchaeota archaeon]